MVKKQCFVISPIGKPGSSIRVRADRVLDQIIRPAVNQCGYTVARADENRTKQVKATTTTPLYHPKYGLIGILCVNIDIDSVSQLDDKGRERFFENYVKNTGYTPRFEKEFEFSPEP